MGKTIRVKTSTLTGPALDWAVEVANGTHWSPNGYFVYNEGKVVGGLYPFTTKPKGEYSTNWSQGGLIIERERIELIPLWLNDNFEGYAASHRLSVKYDEEGEFIYGSDCKQYDQSPLIAAMRCFVASRLGDTVEVPDELA